MFSHPALKFFVWWIVATISLAFVGYAYSQTALPTIKWHPGHYVRADEQGWNNKQDERFRVYDTIRNVPTVLGAAFVVNWGMVENQQGVYDWSYVDAEINYLASMGKRSIITPAHIVYGGSLPGTPQGADNRAIGDYLIDMGCGGNMPYGGHAARLDIPACMDRYIAFIQALAARYDSNPNVEMVTVGETSVYVNGQDNASLAAQWNRLPAILQAAFKETPVVIQNNFLVDVQPTKDLIALQLQYGIGQGGPDLLPGFSMPPNPNEDSYGELEIRGAGIVPGVGTFGTVDNRARVPQQWEAQVVRSELTTPEVVNNYANDHLLSNHTVWVAYYGYDPIQYGGSTPIPAMRWDGSSGVLAYLSNPAHAVTHTACPTAYNGRCSSSGTPTATPPSPPTASGIKWNPGHYVEQQGVQDTAAARAITSNWYALPSPWKGVLRAIQLGAFEGATPGDPVTGVGYEKAKDFMDWHLSQAAANGKHLILTIEDKIYGGFPPSDLQNGLLLPLYLKTNPTYANPSDPAGNNGWYVLSPMGGGGLSVITRSYTPAVMDRYIALGQYLCSQYDGNSALEAITLSGVSVGMTPTQLAESGYSYTAYIEQVKRWLLAMKAACPKTTIGIRLDWPPTYQDALDFWQWAEQHGIAMSDYDTYDWPGRVGAVTPGQGESEGWGKSAFRGAADLGGGNPDPVNSGVAGTDLRGKLPWIGLVEDPDWTRWGQYGVDSMAEFLDIAQFEKYTHMVWAPITWAATPSQFNPPNEGNIWENIIRPCIERGVGCSNSSSGIYTTYPTNYPSSVSPSPTPTPTPSPTPTPTPGRMTIRIGDVVLNMATVAVWDNPGGRVIATLPPDTPGLVVGGPRDLGGYRWWQVQFDEGPTGWVYEHMLQNIQSTAPRGTATTQTTWCSLNGIASTSLAGTCDYVRNESLNINLSTVAGDALGTAELYDPTGSFKGKCGTMSSGPTGHLEIILKTSGTPGPNECVVKPNTDYYVNVSTIIDQLEIVPKPTREDYIVMYAPVTEGTVVQGTPTPNPTPTPSPSTPPPSLTPSIAGLSPTAPYPVTALQASSYFVSTQGNDSSDGRTPATAWRTLAKVNATTLPAGSNVFFRAGEQWNTERLNVTWGGTASDPAVIGSYFIDGTGQAMVGVGNNLRPVFDNQYDARGLYGNVITISSDNVTIQDIEIRNAGDMGVRADRHTNIYVKNVKVDGSYHCGMYFNRDTNVTVEFSEAYNHNTGYGVFGTERTWCNGLAQESTNVTFRNNIVADGYGEGIGAMRGVSGFLYENNILRNNRAVGIYIDSAHDGIVRNNVIYMTGNSPFSGREFGIGLSNEAYQYVANGGNTPSTEYVRNMQIYNNIVAGLTGGAAIGMYDEMGFPYENIQVVNNTFIDNKYGVDSIGASGTTWPASFVFANNIILSQSSFARDVGTPIRSTATVLNNYWSQGAPGGGMDSPGDVYAGLQLQKNSGWSALGPGGFTWQDALPVGNSPTIGAGSQSAGVLHPTADIGGNMFGSPIDMGAVASSPSPSTPSTPSIRSIPTNVRIMPLGDSITEGSWSTAGTDFSGYRSPLYSLLTAAGISPTFVGSATNGNFAQPNHEGHGGYSIQDIFTNIDGWLAANTPDVVLLHIGTNDILGDNDLANAGARLRVLIRRIASQAPNARIVVAQISPFANATDEAQAVQYNRDIATSVTILRNEGIKVTLVDMHTALTASVDLYDGVHPNDNGYTKMAPTWLSGISAVFQNTTTPPPPPPQSNGANLLFATGFEGGVMLNPPTGCWSGSAAGCWQDISGTDSETGFSFPVNMWGGQSRIQLIYGDDATPATIGNELRNSIITANGPKGTQTRVFQQEFNSRASQFCCTQNQFIIFPSTEPANSSHYISFYRKVSPSFLQAIANGWSMLTEWKTTGDIRHSGNITAYGGQPVFGMQADTYADGGLAPQVFWQQQNSGIPIPVDRWYRVETYTKRSSGPDGRYVVAVDGQIIYDYRGATTGQNGNSINRIFPFGMYVSGAGASHQIDDFEIWDGIPSTASFR